MSSEQLGPNELLPVKHSALHVKSRRSCLTKNNDIYNGNNVMTVSEAKWIQIYINGDEHFPGCRCVVNNRYYRNLDMFLNYLTERLQPSFGAVRNLYTPVNGHPVLDLEELVSKQEYVVAGNERFKKLDFGYSDSGMKRNKRYNLKSKNKFKVSKAKPLCHRALTINLYQNGNYKMKPTILNFLSQDLENWEYVYKKISEALKCGPVKRVCSLSGKPIKAVEELVNKQSYVAVGRHEVFKVGYYRNIDKKNTPVKEKCLYDRPSQRSSVLSVRSSGVHSRFSAQSLRLRSSISSCKSNRKTPVSKTSLRKNQNPEFMNKSECLDEYQYFNSYKNFMLKTNSAKSDFVTKINLDLDADFGGVFRSKMQNNQTVGAAEIEDGPDTIVDLPVDLLDAEEIEDDITPDMERSLQHLSLDASEEIVAFLPTMPKKSSDESQLSDKYNMSHSQNLDLRNIFV